MDTLAGLLGYIDRQVSPAKRKLADLLRNPVESGQQMIGGLLDDTRRLDSMYKTAGDGYRLDAQGSVMGGLPQYKQAQQQQLSGLLNVMPIGQTVYHGSPHKFDKFDSSKIGTGEGAQAYGHGLYFAEAPSTAEFYKKTLTDSKINIDGKPYYQAAKSDDVKNFILESGGDINKAIEMANGALDHFTKVAPSFSNRRKAQEALQELQILQKNNSVAKNDGVLYKVDLPDEHIAKMLDWDKPLAEQPHALKAIQKYAAEIKSLGMDKEAKDILDASQMTGMPGEWFHNMAKQSFGPKDLARDLSGYGIPGIRYLDQGSRGAGQGTSNYVVFPGNEGLLSILERNGQAVK